MKSEIRRIISIEDIIRDINKRNKNYIEIRLVMTQD